MESKLLDGPNAGYCSSSDEEDNSGFRVVNDEDEHQANVMKKFGGGSNTGAKGVMEDWRRFQEQQTEDKAARSRAILWEAKRGMLEGNKEERDAAQKSSEEDEDSLESLRRKRLAQLKKVAAGKMVEIQNTNQFLSLTENTAEGLVAVLIYEPGREDCQKVAELCKFLAAEFPDVKFCRVTSTILGMSAKYRVAGVPTLQFYTANGHLVGSFVKISDEIGLEAAPLKLKNFLKRHKISLTLNRYMEDEYSSDDELD